MAVDTKLNEMIFVSKREQRLQDVVEMFLSWTGALAITGEATPDAWHELVRIRSRAEAVLETGE